MCRRKRWAGTRGWGLAVAVGLFVSVLLHEMAHTLYALRHGGEVHGITLMIVGGVSELAEVPSGRGMRR